MIRVRDATPSDSQTIIEFNRLLAEETENKHLDPKKIVPGVDRILQNPATHGRYFIAESATSPVGQLAVTYEWSDWRNGWFWWFQSVYVVPGARRSGVFSTLYDHVMRLARDSAQVCGLRLYVLHANSTALHTYAARGMEDSGYRVLEIDFSEEQQ